MFADLVQQMVSTLNDISLCMEQTNNCLFSYTLKNNKTRLLLLNNISVLGAYTREYCVVFVVAVFERAAGVNNCILLSTRTAGVRHSGQ